MKIVAADSAAAILNDKFMPIYHVASAAVLVEPPYREAQTRIADPIFKEVDNGYEIIVHEAELCLQLLQNAKADIVHIDSSLGGISVEELSPVHLSNMKLSINARKHLLKILPKLRKIAGETTRRYNIEMLAIGKDSIAVRIAELTAGAEAILYTCTKALEDKTPLLLGLPLKCQHLKTDSKVYLHSLIEAEHEISGYAKDTQNVLEKVIIQEMQNPTARGFRALRITPKETK